MATKIKPYQLDLDLLGEIITGYLPPLFESFLSLTGEAVSGVFPYFTSNNTLGLTPITEFGKTFLSQDTEGNALDVLGIPFVSVPKFSFSDGEIPIWSAFQTGFTSTSLSNGSSQLDVFDIHAISLYGSYISGDLFESDGYPIENLRTRRQNAVNNCYWVTGHSGGGTGNLDGLTTSGANADWLINSIVVINSSGALPNTYRLINGTSGTHSTFSTIRPQDYSASLNSKYWNSIALG